MIESEAWVPVLEADSLPPEPQGKPLYIDKWFPNGLPKWASQMGFPDSSISKESACNAGDPSSIPGSGGSAGEGIGYPLQEFWPGEFIPWAVWSMGPQRVGQD